MTCSLAAGMPTSSIARGLHRTSLSCDTLPCSVENSGRYAGQSPVAYDLQLYRGIVGLLGHIRFTTDDSQDFLFLVITIPLPPVIGFSAAEAEQATDQLIESQAVDDTCGTASKFYTAPQRPDSTPGSPTYYSLGQPAAGGGFLFWREAYNIFLVGTSGRVRRQSLSSGSAQSIAVNLNNSTDKVHTDSSYVYFTQDGIKKLPFDAIAIIHDLVANSLEVTQGIQNLNNGVPLVAGKTTYVRGFGTKNAGANAGFVGAFLHGEKGGNPLPGSPLTPINGPHPLTGITIDRNDIDESWLFHLPSSWRSAGNISLELEVDPVNSYDDPNRGNNSLTRAVSFTNKAPVCAVFIPVRTHAPKATTDLDIFWPMVEMAERMLPTREIKAYKQNSDVAELQVCWWGPFPHPCYGPYELKEDKDKILTSLWFRDQFSDDPDSCDDANATTHYVGLVHPSTSTDGLNGSGMKPGDQLLTKMPPLDAIPLDWQSSTRVSTFPHELGHNYNRSHVDCGGPANPDNNYPYTNPDRCRIDDGAQTAASTHFGFDIAAKQPIAPNVPRDLLAYGSPRWPSDYTWKAIYNRIDNDTVAAAGVDLAAAGGVVLVNGTITTTVSQGELDYAWVLPTASASASQLQKWQGQIAAQNMPENVNAAAVSYTVRLVGAGNEVLAEQPAQLLVDEDDENVSVGFGAMLTEPAKQVLRVELLADGAVIDSRAPGVGQPAVSISMPAGGETIDLDLTVNWNGTDPDTEDVLLYTLQYSPDNGSQWRTLISHYASPGGSENVSLNFPNLDDIPGSNGPNARIRVIASDGYNTTVATSNAFTVLDRKPQPHILSPYANQVLEAGDPVLLRGGAYDAETGLVESDKLTWKIDGQPVGSGKDLNVDGLAAGDHIAELTAEDIIGQKASTQVQFTILPLRIPAGGTPTLDGLCNDSAYAAGTQVQLPAYGDASRASVSLVRSGSYLYACFSGMKTGNVSPGASVGLRFDVNNSQDGQAQTDDYGFFVGEDGSVSTTAGDGAGGFANPGPGGLQGQMSATSDRWHAELRIEKAKLGDWDHLVGLMLGHMDVSAADDDYVWPLGSESSKPNTWSTATLGNTPVITSLSPYTVTTGSPQFQLVIEGSGIVSDSLTAAHWGSDPLPTQVISATQVVATVGADRLVNPARVSITVHNPGDGMISNPLHFDVIGQKPIINSLTPNRKNANGSGFVLTVNGEHFVDGASVLWNGESIATTFISDTKLTAQVNGAKSEQGQVVGVTVLNPSPNPETSNTAVLLIEAQSETYLPSLFK